MIQVNKNKSWFFEKINKINESLDRQTHEGKKIEESNPKNQDLIRPFYCIFATSCKSIIIFKQKVCEKAKEGGGERGNAI